MSDITKKIIKEFLHIEKKRNDHQLSIHLKVSLSYDPSDEIITNFPIIL